MHCYANLPTLGNLSAWSEEPRTLGEQIAMRSVRSGQESTPVKWNGAKREPFLSLEAIGGRKHQTVFRLNGGPKITVHFWLSNGIRAFLKVKTA